MVPKTCSANECDNRVVCKQLCSKHYYRLRRTGKLELDRPTWPERFWKKVDKTESCWLWTAAKSTGGYGLFGIGGSGNLASAHRVSYEMANGPIPPDMLIDHICHDRSCVNPDHLRLATTKQNNENLSGAHSDSKSGVRGVSWSKQAQKWHAQVKHNGKATFVGRFISLEDAEKAVIARRNELFTHNILDRRSA